MKGELLRDSKAQKEKLYSLMQESRRGVKKSRLGKAGEVINRYGNQKV